MTQQSPKAALVQLARGVISLVSELDTDCDISDIFDNLRLTRLSTGKFSLIIQTANDEIPPLDESDIIFEDVEEGV